MSRMKEKLLAQYQGPFLPDTCRMCGDFATNDLCNECDFHLEQQAEMDRQEREVQL
jgi:hypothetical protein